MSLVARLGWILLLAFASGGAGAADSGGGSGRAAVGESIRVAPAGADSPGTAKLPTLTVFAAASLKESLDAVTQAWLARSGQNVVVSYAASSALARQIERDAPANLFIPADRDWMDTLQAAGRIDPASRFDLLANRLVLVAPADSSLRSVAVARPASFRAALGSGRLSVAETVSVPAGRYAKQSLIFLGLWESASKQLAEAENVRAALAFVARGEAPLGIVYATDAQAEPRVRVIAVFPERSHDPIVYPAARLTSADPSASKGFIAFLRGKQAQRIFTRAGFRLP